MRPYAFVIAFIAVSLQSVADNPFVGLRDSEIATVIRRDFAPKQFVTDLYGPHGRYATVYEYARKADGLITDYFNPDGAFETDETWQTPPSGMELFEVTPMTWWKNADDDTPIPTYDMHCTVPAASGTMALRGNSIPGAVSDIKYDGKYWVVGFGTIAGVVTNTYMPPRGREGDFARIIMYAAVVYQMPDAPWHAEAAMLFNDYEAYPVLNAYATRTLMAWHTADPPDDFERRRDAVIASAQGNGNPFVSYPQLASYLWGDNKGLTYDDNPANRQPLKAVYSIAADKIIDLYSPYVPVDAVWTIDNIAVNDTYIDTGAVGRGMHELRYVCGDIRGKIIIEIKQ